MADLLCVADVIPISFIGCGMTRRALLGLEPGSRIWLEVEGETLLFERIEDGHDCQPVRALRAVEASLADWDRIRGSRRGAVLELALIERPVDAGRSAARWSDDDLPTN